MKMIIKNFKGKYAFLSNFYRSEIVYQGLVYLTAEHLYQALKTRKIPVRETIRKAKTPGEAKKLGGEVDLRKDWEYTKDSFMGLIIHLKFHQNVDLMAQLLNTHPLELIEGNWWHDNYWGNCECPKCVYITGQNKLGKILMERRKEIIQSKNV